MNAEHLLTNTSGIQTTPKGGNFGSARGSASRRGLEFAKYLFTWLTGIPLTIGGLLGAVTAPANGIGSQLLGLAGSQIPGFGPLKPILGMITPGTLGQTAGPVSLPQIIFNIPDIIASLAGLSKFLPTNSHGRYWVDPIFEGLTAEDHAAGVVRQLTAA